MTLISKPLLRVNVRLGSQATELPHSRHVRFCSESDSFKEFTGTYGGPSKIYIFVLCVTYLSRNRAYSGTVEFVAYGGSHDHDARLPPNLSR